MAGHKPRGVGAERWWHLSDYSIDLPDPSRQIAGVVRLPAFAALGVATHEGEILGGGRQAGCREPVAGINPGTPIPAI